MKNTLTTFLLMLCIFASAQTLPDSTQKQFAEIREQQSKLTTMVAYGGRDIKTGASLLAPGLTLMAIGSVLGILPTKTGEKGIAGMPVKRFAGVICIGAGGVFSLAGALSIFNGGKKLHRQTFDL